MLRLDFFKYRLLGGVERWVRSIFTLDLRALALVRIGLGTIILIDLLSNSFSFTAHFTDAGVLPVDLLLQYYTEENTRSIRSISGSYVRQLTLFIINALVAAAFLLGWKTRYTNIAVRILFCGLSARNPLIINGGDVLLRMLLFRGMFLPMGAVRSMDAKKLGTPPQVTFFSRATVGLIAQMVFVYVFSFHLKTHPQWTSEFTAIYTALSLDVFRTSLGTRLYQYPELMKLLTQAVIYLEGYGFLLLLIPWKHSRRKTIGCLIFITFHIGLVLTMKLGHFPRTAIMGRIAILPTPFRNALLGSYTIGKIPLSKIWKGSVVRSAFLIICLGYIFLRNLRTTNFDKRDDIFPRTINKFGFLLRLDQYRSMFAPYPMEDDGRWVIKGTTMGGNEIDMFTPSLPVSYEKPDDFSVLYPNEKWRKYLNNLRQRKNDVYRAPYLHYLCNRRNSKHPTDPLETISMEYVTERTEPDYQSKKGETVFLEEIRCGN